VPVPPLVPQTDEERAWFAAAQRRRLKRMQERERTDD
jgi:hypothetical protein